MAHAAGVSNGDSGMLFFGAGGVGKTVFALELVKSGLSFFGDDLVIIGRSGELLSFPKRIRLRAPPLPIVPDFVQRIGSNMGPVRRSMFKRLIRKNPETLEGLIPRLPISEILAGAKIGNRSSLDVVVHLKRGTSAEMDLKETDNESMASALAVEIFREFTDAPWRHDEFKYCPSIANGIDFTQEEAGHHTMIDGIVRSAIKKSRTFEMKLPSRFEASRVVEMLRKLI